MGSINGKSSNIQPVSYKQKDQEADSDPRCESQIHYKFSNIFKDSWQEKCSENDIPN